MAQPIGSSFGLTTQGEFCVRRRGWRCVDLLGSGLLGLGWGLLTVAPVAAADPPVDFMTEIKPVLAVACVSCHCADVPEGGLELDTLAGALQGGDSGPALVPGDPAASALWTRTTLPADDDLVMPPEGAADPLTAHQSERLRLWIAQGASWPPGLTLTAEEPSPPSTPPDTPDTPALVHALRAKIVETVAETARQSMESYAAEIPLTGAAYHMVAIAGGEFLMGSPLTEPAREPHEGPPTRVRVDAFWIGKYEVTWDEYEPFMVTQVDRRKDGMRKDYDSELHSTVDAVSQPTAPYMEMSFGMGQKGYPAISMTQHAANKYCQWLSAQTGHFYRLPTEAEWEYACRAGTTTAYSCGDDPAVLGEFAWYYDNSNEKYQPVGLKRPNAWGLYDMHGNVMEWTADAFGEDYFGRLGAEASNPLVKPESLYPRSVRGGGWDDDPERLRSAARRGSDPSWKQQDPQLPKSKWYHTDARWLGFRIVRPLEVPSAEEMDFYWNNATHAR